MICIDLFTQKKIAFVFANLLIFSTFSLKFPKATGETSHNRKGIIMRAGFACLLAVPQSFC